MSDLLIVSIAMVVFIAWLLAAYGATKVADYFIERWKAEMTNEEAIAQIDSLAQVVADNNARNPNEIWDNYINALGIAIEAIRAKKDKPCKRKVNNNEHYI